MAEDKEQEETNEVPEDEATDGDTTDDAANDDAPAEEPAAEAAAPQPRVAVQVDDSDTTCTYANFCRVTGSPEELNCLILH